MSTGPTLAAPDRTDPTTGTDPETAATSFALRHAKRTFDPFNTRKCPEMFDKWTAE